MFKLFLALTSLPLRVLPEPLLASWFTALIKLISLGAPADRRLRLMFAVDTNLNTLEGEAAKDYDQGVHPKHRLIKYSRFFVEKIKDGDKILDIGCGNGFLDNAVVEKRTKCHITGIDFSQKNINYCRKHYPHPNLNFVCADALKYKSKEKIDVIIFSNVMEHIQDRINFLKSAQKHIAPKRWLIRVPLYERDWRVPLMEELKVDYRLDKTHFTEYTQEQFAKEVNAAGLTIKAMEVHWGEIWSEVIPK
jgi:ubiquinone/menaquinone biosynthesis C-methylase UbiE